MSTVTIYAPGAVVDVITTRVIYVSTSGSDASDGLTQATAVASLERADGLAQAGDTIALRCGDTWASSVARRLSHSGGTSVPIVWDGHLWGSGPPAAIVSSAHRTPGNMAIVNIAGASDLTLQHLTVDGANTKVFGVVIGGGSDGYYSAQGVQHAERAITVQDCLVKNCGNGSDYRIGLLVQTWHDDISNIVIQRNTIDGADDEALSFYPGRSDLGATPSRIRDSYIGYNTVTNYGRRNTTTAYGLQINNKITNIVVEHNTVTTGASGFRDGMHIESNEPIPGYFPTGVIVRYNDIRVTNKYALYIQGGQAITADVYYNVFTSGTVATNGTSGGIVIKVSSSPTYAGALMRFFNNTIVVAGDRGMDDNSGISGAVLFRNNLVYHTGSDLNNQFAVYVNVTGSMIHDHNALFRSAGASAKVVLTDNGAHSYQRASAPTWEPTVVAGDPLLMDLAAFDFRLKASSPALNAGVDVGLLADILGIMVPHGSAPDIGAYETA